MFKYLPEMMRQRMDLENWLRVRTEETRERFLKDKDGHREAYKLALGELLRLTVQGIEPGPATMQEYKRYKEAHRI